VFLEHRKKKKKLGGGGGGVLKKKKENSRLMEFEFQLKNFIVNLEFIYYNR
jgi:hypothetical protein